MDKRVFGVNSTNACKGVALVLLLWHHLFFSHSDFGSIVQETALAAKVCVAIFLILSGYGYSESIKSRRVGLFGFYKDRLIHLYSNYWFIALIFVPVGILFMHRTLESAFSSHAYARFMIQMTGLHRFAYSEYGYNETWWYMSVIIALVALFPLIHVLTKGKYGLFLLLFLLVISIPAPVGSFFSYLLPFALGAFLSQRDHISAISTRLGTFGWWRFVMLTIAIVLVAVFRYHSPLFGGEEIDWLFGSLIILFVFELTTTNQRIGRLLSRLGTHLFNVFLFHTFIFLYYWNDFIYSFKQPVLIFIVLLSLCIAISVSLEYLKKSIGFYWVIERVRSLKVPSQSEIAFIQGGQADVRGSHRRALHRAA